LQANGHVTVEQRQDVRIAFDDGDVEAAMGARPLMNAAMRSMSGMSRSVKTCGKSTPGIGGTMGIAP
jgi:hypothetical protein